MSSQRIKSISEYHHIMGLPKPGHPMISIISFETIKRLPAGGPIKLVLPFYSIGLKRNFNARMKYGQQEYDFDEGILTCMAPGQVLQIETETDQLLNHSGWLLLVHPDFLWSSPMASKIRQYTYFSYAVHEALFLSKKEELTLIAIFKNIAREYQGGVDAFTQDLIVAQLDILLIYINRYYARQFATRKIANHRLLEKAEELLARYLDSGQLAETGLPTVQIIAEHLSVSPGYLSAVLKTVTGKSTQQHIQEKLLEKAKEKLSATSLSMAEIAYELGFSHSQSFSKFFRSQTQLSPTAFRQSFTTAKNIVGNLDSIQH
ncbi:helix-turn-helix domain-containing protein [Dyadobacter sp. 676]|uniref:Helix-turn-helix domain-containing protein n=1 Tax=Dyadobacter sp. 676 TaxID=3088362 RepID=A0AAU8FIB9_9BACT